MEYYLTNLDFPEIRGPISLPKRYLLGDIGRVRSRANLTRTTKPPPIAYPRQSMYGIFTYIWLILMVNVGKYTIH